jgi:hypothetical protein
MYRASAVAFSSGSMRTLARGVVSMATALLLACWSPWSVAGSQVVCTIERIELKPDAWDVALPGRHRLSGLASTRCSSAMSMPVTAKVGLVDRSNAGQHTLVHREVRREKAVLELYSDAALSVRMPGQGDGSGGFWQAVVVPAGGGSFVDLPFHATLETSEPLSAGTLESPATLGVWLELSAPD